MITFKQFLAEDFRRYTPLQSFFIMCWGKLLYLDYEHLPVGKDESSNPELKRVMANYHKLGDDELQQEEEWISEGGSMNGGKTHLFSRATVDAVFKSAEHEAGKDMILYRFDHTPNKLRPNSWISMSKKDHGYPGNRSEFHIKANTMIIDAHELADDNEVIVNTNELQKGNA